MNKEQIFLIGLGIVLLPIWRVAKVQGGINLLEYAETMIKKDKPYEHIPYEEAVRRAHEAYLSVKRT